MPVFTININATHHSQLYQISKSGGANISFLEVRYAHSYVYELLNVKLICAE